MIFLVPWVLMFLPVKCTDLDLGNAIDLLQHYGIVGKMLPVADDSYDSFLEKSFSSNVLNKSLPFNKKCDKYLLLRCCILYIGCSTSHIRIFFQFQINKQKPIIRRNLETEFMP